MKKKTKRTPPDPNAMALPVAHFEILTHALGLEDPRDCGAEPLPTRNDYVVPAGDPDIEALVAFGYLRNDGSRSWLLDNASVYRVTEAGRALVLRIWTALRPRFTRAQKRYRAYLRYDGGYSFGEWLKRGLDKPTV